jgi:anti-sigma regulatory factor (Ser/Thr protein kinase)
MPTATEITGDGTGIDDHVVGLGEDGAEPATEIGGRPSFARTGSTIAGALQRAQFRATFAAEVDAPGRARRLLAAALRDRGYAKPLVEEAMLVASELAANAVLHARSGFSIEVRADDAMVRVAVEDGSPPDATLDIQMMPRRTHGLGLVNALATRWGVYGTKRGKVVFAELAVPPAEES